MLEQQDNGGNRELRGKGREEGRVDVGGSDVLESPRNRAQNPDRISAVGACPMTTEKPCGEGKDDHDKGIPQNRDEEKDAGWTGMRLLSDEQGGGDYRPYLGYFLLAKSQLNRMAYKKKSAVIPKAASSLVTGKPFKVLMTTL